MGASGEGSAKRKLGFAGSLYLPVMMIPEGIKSCAAQISFVLDSQSLSFYSFYEEIVTGLGNYNSKKGRL
jgi:hypothetical protein